MAGNKRVRFDLSFSDHQHLQPDHPRHVFSDTRVLGGRGFKSSSPAMLSLESHIQDPNVSSTLLPGSETAVGPTTPRKLHDTKPRLLLMGQRRSGKSSIASVVFHKMPPTETLFLESTTRIQKDSMHSFMDFQVWDFPGQIDYFDPNFDADDIFGEHGALVWVIDAQDDYTDSIARLTTSILNVQATSPSINIEVFVHKVDGLSEEYRRDTFQDIVQTITDELQDAGYENAGVNFHLTSIYDYSIFEAFSKVIQKLIPQMHALENLLNIVLNSCGMEKAYLFDVLSKIYIASDTRPVDMACYEMCSDYIDVIVDISELYSWDHEGRVPQGDQMPDAASHCIVHDNTMIHLAEMNKYLCLVSVIKKEDAKNMKGLIDYNCRVFQDSLNDVFERAWEKEDEAAGPGAAIEQ